MPITLSGSTGITTDRLNADFIYDEAGTAGPSLPFGTNEAVFSNPVGTLILVTGTTVPIGYVAAQGQTLSRTGYAQLWAFAQTSGNMAASDGVWTKGQFSPGDGSTTFRVPDLRDRYIRGASGTRAVGLVEEDAMQGHWHEAYMADGSGPVTSGYWAVGGTTGIPAVNTTKLPAKHVLEAISDGTNGTPRIANETRVKGIAYLWCIKAFDVISNPAILNAQSVVNELGRLDVDKLDAAEIVAPGSAPKYVCRAWVNFTGTAPAVILSSGNVSSVVRTDTGKYTINFTTPMPDVNYNAVFGCRDTSIGAEFISETIGFSKTTSSFGITNWNFNGSRVDSANIYVSFFR